MFLFFCFCINCIHHEIYPAEEGEKLPPEKTFKEKIRDKLDYLESYRLYDSSVPLSGVWINTNFKSYDYVKFFNTACPKNKQEISANKMTCGLSLKPLEKFSITKTENEIIIEFENFAFNRGKRTFVISAVWEIKGTKDNFTISKYEQIVDDGYTYAYKIINTKFDLKNGKAYLSASGVIGNYGVYGFYYDDFYYGKCPNKPVGQMYVSSGSNDAKGLFIEDSKCSDYIPVEINDRPGKWNFNGSWTLQDLFESIIQKTSQ